MAECRSIAGALFPCMEPGLKNIFESEKLLAHAFKALFDFVVSMDATGAKDEEATAFSYILTPKQVDEIDRVCDANQWQKITTHGIEIGVSAIQHVLKARRLKDEIEGRQGIV